MGYVDGDAFTILPLSSTPTLASSRPTPPRPGASQTGGFPSLLWFYPRPFREFPWQCCSSHSAEKEEKPQGQIWNILWKLKQCFRNLDVCICKCLEFKGEPISVMKDFLPTFPQICLCNGNEIFWQHNSASVIGFNFQPPPPPQKKKKSVLGDAPEQFKSRYV